MIDFNALAGLKVESGDFAMALADMPQATVAYLLANGFSQSLTDARTTASAKALNDACKAWAKEMGREPTAQERATIKEASAADMESAGLSAMAKRMDALREGTMVYGARGPNGPRKSPEEAYIWGRAEADAKAACAKAGIKFPKDSEAVETLLGKFIAKNGADYKKAFTKQAKDADDTSELLAGLV